MYGRAIARPCTHVSAHHDKGEHDALVGQAGQEWSALGHLLANVVNDTFDIGDCIRLAQLVQRTKSILLRKLTHNTATL